MLSTEQNPASLPEPQPLARAFAKHLAIVTAFNIVIAIVGTYALHLEGSFIQNLVFSLCIGTIAYLLIDGARTLLWGTGMPPRLPFIGIVIVAMPLAKVAGSRLATHLLDLDPEMVAAHTWRNTSSTFILTALSCAIVSWFFWRSGEVAQLKLTLEAAKARAAAIEKQALQAQLQMLQAQIEPHMLFNTLANLQALIAVDPPRAQHMLDQLIQFLRATLSSSRAGQTTLGQEFALIDAYLGLMAVRMGARLSYALHLPEELRELTVPPMLLQPLVENAIKHGLEPNVDGGRIEVSASRDAQRLTLRVADDGLGLAPASTSSGTRVGVANTRERLQALYGEHAAFSLEPVAPHGAAATITLPL